MVMPEVSERVFRFEQGGLLAERRFNVRAVQRRQDGVDADMTHPGRALARIVAAYAQMTMSIRRSFSIALGIHPLVNLVGRRRFDTRHCLVCGLGTLPEGESSPDEPALLRRPEFLNQRVDARLALIAVGAIASHIISSRTEFALVGRARLVLGGSRALGHPDRARGLAQSPNTNTTRRQRRRTARQRAFWSPCWEGIPMRRCTAVQNGTQGLFLAIAPVRPDRPPVSV
jgi:hypothetical protein